MDIRALISIEIKKNDRTYVFNMPVGAPYGEAYDAAYEVTSKILQLAAEAAEKNRAQTDAPVPVQEAEASS